MTKSITANDPVEVEKVTIQKLAEEPIKDFMQNPVIMQKFNEVLEANSQSFITSVLQVVMSSALLAQATQMSIYISALRAATMKLPVNPNLGFAYIIPFKSNKKVGNEWITTVEAQLQIGWKGFVQLAQRSGQFKTVNTTEIYENQLDGIDIKTGEISLLNVLGSGEIAGYLAHFSLINGFGKSLYMTAEEMEAHGKKYSQSYKGSMSKKSLWTTDFLSMAKKTVLKLLLSRFAPLSIEMQTAIQVDQSASTVEEIIEYPDNPKEIEKTGEEKKEELRNNQENVAPKLQ